MKLLTILKEAIHDLPERKSAGQISAIIDQVIDDTFDETIRKTRIPRPPSSIEIAIEDLQYRYRRSKHYKKTHKRINYDLWYALYHAKLELSNMGETSRSKLDLGTDITSNFDFAYGTRGNTSSMLDVSLSDGPTVTPSSELTYFSISGELETRILEESTVSSFVSCIEQTCRERNSELSMPAKFHLEQKRDLENPNWDKIILNVKYKKLKMESAIKEWEYLRGLIDLSLNRLNPNEIDVEKLKKLRNMFYIKLIP